jgi:hypothetical protein
MPFPKFLGDPLDRPAGPGPVLHGRRFLDDFVRLIVQAQQGITIGPAEVLFANKKDIITHNLVTPWAASEYGPP